MKGAVFNGFEKFVIKDAGLKRWQQLIDACKLPSEGIYLASDFYDDSELVMLVQQFSKLINIDVSIILRKFGQYIFDDLHSTIPTGSIVQADNLFDFLLSVDRVIHVQVKRADPQAYTPTLFYDQVNENTLMIRYVSHRKLCFFAEGLILSAADLYKTNVKVEQVCCQYRNDEECIIKVELCQIEK